MPYKNREYVLAGREYDLAIFMPFIDVKVMNDAVHHIEVLQAREGDISALSTIGAVLQPVKTESYFRKCLQEQESGKRAVFMARLNGADAGYAMLNRRPKYSLYSKLSIPEIQDLNVIPAARQQGVATVIIKHCEDVARQEGTTDIGISVGLHSAFGAAQRLYVKLGYMPDGYGVTYDRQTVAAGEFHVVDDNLCLMMVKEL